MIVTSVNNEYIKGLCKLKDKKYRDSTNLFLIEGEHLVNEAINEDLVKELVILEGCSFEYADKYADNITYVNENVMKKLSSMDSYPNIIGVAYKRKEDKIGSRVLVLEDIQDPGNLGTIVRSAAAFNIDTIILSPRTVDLYNLKVIRATQGMIFHLNIITRELEPTIKGTNVRNGTNIKDINISGNFALIIGNEGRGMSDTLSKLCDKNVYIKMNERVESLNAAVATSIILYEINNGIN